MTNRHIIDRQLPERAKLAFYFPKPTQGEEYYIARVPFFENVVIKETKKARYQKYSLISRSSNLYSYLGADSRQLNLSFNMTLPHILEEHPGLKLEEYIDYYTSDKMNLESEKQKFKEPFKASDKPGGAAFLKGKHYISAARESAERVIGDAIWFGSLNYEDIAFLSTKYGIAKQTFANQLAKQSLLSAANSAVTMFGGAPADTDFSQNSAQISTANQNETATRDAYDQLKYRIIDIIIFWTNIIRASLVNHAQNPIYGPPIIRLNHGILYQDIPCICTSYTIDYNEAAGYDIDTLLPRQLQINMKLEEIRTGDFGAFNSEGANNIIKRDNLAGWEAVVLGEAHSMDPGALEAAWSPPAS